MTAEMIRDHVAKLSVETADQLTTRDIHELCDAAEEAILAGGGFGWLSPRRSDDSRTLSDHC